MNTTRPGSPTRLGAGLLAALAAVIALTPSLEARASESPVPESVEAVIVELAPGADAASVARQLGITPSQVFTTALNGFAGDVTRRQRAGLLQQRSVVGVRDDRTVAALGPAVVRPALGSPPLRPATFGRGPRYEVPEQPAQLVTQEIQRVGADRSRTAAIDGRDRRVNADIAVLDSGIDPYHPELNVVGGHNCIRGDSGGWWDRDGHGTFVAGLAAAKDNATGTVGVAPGARLWSVRVVDPDGFVSDSALLCGLEWLSRNAWRIEVANLSLSGDENENPIGPCVAGWRAYLPSVRRNLDLVHQEICRATSRGVTVVAAAGNDAVDSTAVTPATYAEVITVSAMVDFDGLPGSLTEPPGYCYPEDVDDTFAVFSNFGKPVDVAAPGVCVTSTYPGGLYGVGDGTSFAAPLVSGGAALLRSQRRLSPAQVRARLLADAQPGPIPGDPDAYPEGVLDVSRY